MMYVNILRANLKTSARKLGLEDRFCFQQDNDPKHTVLFPRKFLLYNASRRLLTPLHSSNMNVIENLWSLLEVEVCKKKKNQTSKTWERTSEYTYKWWRGNCENSPLPTKDSVFQCVKVDIPSCVDVCMYVCVRPKMIFSPSLFFCWKRLTYLLSCTETTAQHHLWLYRRTAVNGIQIVSPLFICILKGEALQDAWSEICSPVTANLVDSMTYYSQVVINENGMHTNYKPTSDHTNLINLSNRTTVCQTSFF